MIIHATLTPAAHEAFASSAGALALAPQARELMGKLRALGMADMNLLRALRQGIVSGRILESGLRALQELPEVASVEIDGLRGSGSAASTAF